MYSRLRILFIVPVVAALLAMSAPASACVGKNLSVAGVGTPDVMAVAEMLAVLITERTGTTVTVTYYKDYPRCYEALKNNEVDIVIDFTGRCYTDVLGKGAEPDAAKVFSTVKEAYQRDLNLVWLEPFGFTGTGAEAGKGGAPAIAAPVLRKDTLNKFPALPRVINKLSGRLTNEVISKLVGQGTDEKVLKKTTRKYLKDNRLI